jgi:hypothetical protein
MFSHLSHTTSRISLTLKFKIQNWNNSHDNSKMPDRKSDAVRTLRCIPSAGSSCVPLLRRRRTAQQVKDSREVPWLQEATRSFRSEMRTADWIPSPARRPAPREHAVELFSWRAIAERTTALYGSLVG